jgi:hypothetical protein
MSKSRQVRFFDYVNHPYEQVRDALREDALAAFRKATRGASSRVENLASELHLKIAGFAIGKDIAISVRKIEEDQAPPPVTRLELEWEASESPRLFPLMHAELSIYPLTATETQLDLLGHYEPPLGVLGSALDAIAGRRFAEASVHSFVKEVASYLRSTLP